MSLVKWMRKNNKKIMTVVVILIMIGFVGGIGLQQWLSRLGTGSGGVVATYLDDGKITRLDRFNATNELKVLRSLFAAELLRYRQTAFQSPDVKTRLLGQLLFPDTQAGAMANVELYQAMARRQLNATSRQIDDFFKQQQLPADIAWLLLKDEAKRAGVVVSPARARDTLKVIIPQIAQQMTGRPIDAAQLVNSVMNNYGISEDGVVGIYADLLAIITYAEIVTSSENLTTPQLRATVGRSRETLSAEVVKFAADEFLDEVPDPNGQPLIQQFEEFKAYVPDDITEDNPYGFGYMLPDRLALEYLIVKTSDVKEQVKQPTPEELEKYYIDNIEDYKEEIPDDPNNPDAGTTKVNKPFADVVTEIRRKIINDRTDELANLIMNRAAELADEGVSQLNIEEAASDDLKAAAVPYKDIARQIIEQYKVVPYTGTTGMLSMAQLANDRNLGMLTLQGQSQMPVQLTKMVFAVDGLQTTELGRFEIAPPRMWQNIGPLQPQYGGMLLAIVRIVDTAKAEAPANLNVAYNTQQSIVNQFDKGDDQVYSVRDEVVDDLMTLAAMDLAKARADEFVALLDSNKWEEAIDAYNEKYHDPNAPAPPFPARKLKSDKLSDLRITSEQDLKNTRQLLEDNPMAARYVRNSIESKMLNDELYQLLGKDKLAADDINSVIEFKPASTVYVVKDLSRSQATEKDYTEAKPFMAFQTDAVESGGLALIHFGPENIVERMNVEWITDEEQADEEQEEKSTEETSS